MYWADKLAGRLDADTPQLINDSKTPSGQAHVGSLRGVLIHDVMFRVLRDKGFQVRYTYGVDDFDPLDELPYGKDKQFEPYLGKPLCNVPPPPDSDATDMSEYYISQFFKVFDYLGVHPEVYRMRDVYRAGEFDEMIDTILRHADIVREVYKSVSGSERPANWHPFQAICENCGRIGTTEVTAYDGKEVTYTCRTDMVSWATGCGHQGKVSPFSGNGKLPWKLEWVAKWAKFGITIEGAGKDHTTKGGSRDVADTCLRRIFKHKPPLNIPYEFFLVEGAKMSSSKGIGVTAVEMADFLPPEILRFLMLRPQPNRPINFSPDEQSIVKLFNEFDRFREKTFSDENGSEETREVYRLSEVEPEDDYFAANLQLLQALAPMPHIDVIEEIGKRKSEPLTDLDLKHLNRRLESVQYWLENYAGDDEKMQLRETLPASVAELDVVQRAFLHRLGNALVDAEWEAEALQVKVFDVTRTTPIKQPLAFQAMYTALFNRKAGPRAGNLFVFLEREYLVQHFQAVEFDTREFWRAAHLSREDFDAWLQEHSENITSASVEKAYVEDTGALELCITLKDGKIHARRLLFEVDESAFDAEAESCVKQWSEAFNLTV